MTLNRGIPARMQSRDLSPRRSLAFGMAAFALLALAACGSGSDSPTVGPSGGATGASGGPGGGATGVAGSSAAGSGGLSATAGTSAGLAGGAGAPASGSGGGSTAGSSSGGAPTTAGASGASSAGASTGGASGTANCAGRSISLASNSTGSADDAAYSQVVVDLMTALPIGNAKRTVEFWAYIKTTDWVGDKNEIYYYGASGTTTAFGLDFGTPTVGTTTNHATLNPTTDQGFNDDSGADLGINSSTDQWVHIAMTWDQTALRTYVNGTVRITTGPTGGKTMLLTAQGVLRIGCNPENKYCFNGWFDEFRVWNVARSDAEIKGSYNKPLVGNEPGLVGYWKFDDAVGSTTAADSSTTGTPHAGMLSAAATNQLPTFGTPPAPLPLSCP